MAATTENSKIDPIGSARFFDELPGSAHVQLAVVCVLYACSSATVWRRVSAGLIPAPIKLGPNQTRWKVSELREDLAEKLAKRG